MTLGNFNYLFYIEAMMSEVKTIMFIHGAWVNSKCWNLFKSFFEQQGYNCITPDWPYKNKTVEELNTSPDARLAKLGITEIVNHYQELLEDLETQPFLIGHSFGGLFVQMLLDRGYGKAGIAIDSAPPKGVTPIKYFSVLRANFPILKNPFNRKKVVHITQNQFNYAFVHLLSKEQQIQVYQDYVVPESGKIFFQAAFADFTSTTKINFKNENRAPLLLIAGSKDKIIPAKLNRVNFRKYKNSTKLTEYKVFENRCHWIIAQDGWEEVAEYCHNWLNRLDN